MINRRFIRTGFVMKITALIVILLLFGVAYQPAVVNANRVGEEDETKTESRGRDEIPGPFRNLDKLVSDLLNQTTDTNDTDGDGLPDSVEWVIGTDHNNSDSDFDTLSDYWEIFNNMDPNNPDSNGDHLADYYEVNNVSHDLDGDGTPNAWDWDNDDDGVMDDLDLSPFAKTNHTDALAIEVNTTGKPTYISFQLRPVNPNHLRLIDQVWDWPDDDRGTIRDLDGSVDDVTVNPTLEFSSNSLPNASDLGEFGISRVNDSAFIPLFPVWEFGNIVAFKGRMFYPEDITLSNISASVKLCWKVNGKTDTIVKALQAPNGFYLSADENGEVRINATEIEDNQIFDWIKAGSGFIALRTENGHYLTMEPDGRISAAAAEIGDSELFMPKDLQGNTIALKANNGKYLTIKPDGSVVADAASSVSASPFTKTDKGVRPHVMNLVTYYEDFMLTGLTVEENYGTTAGIFYSADRDEMIAANLVLGYDFLRNATYDLENMPANLMDNHSISLNSTISSFSHKEPALAALIQDMPAEALGELPDGDLIPLIAALEDRSISMDLSNLSTGEYILGNKLHADLTGKDIITSRAMKTTWYNTSTDDPLDLEEIVGEMQTWDLPEDSKITLIALTIAWGTGETTVVRVGPEEIDFRTWEIPKVDTTALKIIKWGIKEMKQVIGIVRNIRASYCYSNPARLTQLASKTGTIINSYSDAVKAVSKIKTGAMGIMNRIGKVIEVIGILVEVAIIAYSVWAIGDALGWTPTGTGIAVSYGILTTVYATTLILLAVLGGPVGAIIAALIALSDLYTWLMCGSSWSELLFGEIIGWFVDLFSDIDVRSEVNVEPINSTSKIEDLDENGIDAGDRIWYISHMYANVTTTSHGNYADLRDSYVNPRHTVAVPWYSNSNTYTYASTESTNYYTGKKSTVVESGLWVEPGIGMVNFPIAVGLSTDYRVYYDDCWWWLFYGWDCDRESDTGTSSSHWTSLYFDVMPGSIHEFANWRGIISCDWDGDGLNNTNETRTNAWNWDSDGDGLGDKYEGDIGTDPTKMDSDRDGLDDRFEHLRGMDPLGKDTDSDGLSDYLEYTGWVVPFIYYGKQFYWHVNSDGKFNDTDGDGIEDYLEHQCLLNPISSDTDGDGTSDELLDYYITEFNYDSTFGPPDPEWDGSALLECVVDNDGYLYALVRKGFDPTAVLKYYPNGTFKEELPIPGVFGIAMDSHGDLYVTGGAGVKKYDSNGLFIEDVINTTLIASESIVLDEIHGYLYVTEAEGGFLMGFYLSNGTSFCIWKIDFHAYRGGMAVDTDGYVYLAYSGEENDVIHKFHPNDTEVMVIGSSGLGEGQFIDSRDVEIDQHGNLLITDSGNNRIQKLNSTGRFITSFGTEGTGEDNLSSPSGICLDGDYLYVMDNGNHRIQKIEYNVWLEQVNPTQTFTDTDGDGLTDEQERIGWNVASSNSTDVSRGIRSSSRGTIDHYKVTSDEMLLDTDGDGLSDFDEFNMSTDPRSIDTDRDGVSDFDEVILGTNATNCDTDGDLLEDGMELNFRSDPKKNDTDGEGLTDYQEYLLGSDPNNTDSDWDGLDDAEEAAFGSNLTDPDEDDDFMFDSQEQELGTSSNKTDHDGDGIKDGFELLHNTSPTNGDTDGDNLTDGFELSSHLDPLSNDTDGDGVEDNIELELGLNPRSRDTDGDGIPDNLDTDHEITLEDDIVLVFDPDDATYDFMADLSAIANVTVVTPQEFLTGHTDARYIVLVGWPDAGAGTAGEIIKDLVEDSGDVLDRMIESRIERTAVRYGYWNNPQTIVMLSHVQPSDHLRVVGILKSMLMTVSEDAISVEYYNARSSFKLDQMDVITTTNAIVSAQLNNTATFKVDMKSYNETLIPIELTNTTGLHRGEFAMGKYLEVTVSKDLQNETVDMITGSHIRLYYTEKDLDRTGDGDANDQEDFNETTLVLYVFDQEIGEWLRLTDTLDWVNGIGVDTRNVELYGRVYEGYVWVNITHFSIYGIAGMAFQKVEPPPDDGDDEFPLMEIASMFIILFVVLSLLTLHKRRKIQARVKTKDRQRNTEVPKNCK